MAKKKKEVAGQGALPLKAKPLSKQEQSEQAEKKWARAQELAKDANAKHSIADSKKRHYDEAKKAAEAADEALRQYVTPLPMFDQAENRPRPEDAKGALPEGKSPDWRKIRLDTIFKKVPKAIAETAGYETLGQVVDHIKFKPLTSIHGFGPAAAEKFTDELTAWYLKNPYAASAVDAELNTAANKARDKAIQKNLDPLGEAGKAPAGDLPGDQSKAKPKKLSGGLEPKPTDPKDWS